MCATSPDWRLPDSLAVASGNHRFLRLSCWVLPTSADAFDLADADGAGDCYHGGRREQGWVAGERDERGRDGRADGVRAHDGDVDDAEVLGPVVGLRQYLGDQRLVDRDIGTEADAEQHRRDQRGRPGFPEGQEQRRDRHEQAGYGNQYLAAAAAVGDDPADNRGQHYADGVYHNQDEQAVRGVLAGMR